MEDTKNPDSLLAPSGKPLREETIIAHSFAIAGEIEAKEDTFIQGRVEGSVLVEDHTLRIGRQAEVSGEILSKRVIVEGKVEGQLKATQAVVLRQTAKVKGTILAPQVGMEEGCQFNGEVKMDASALSVASARARKGKNRGPVMNR
jgi:cytoskeletal protein CcmA (bactofilin family)